MTVGRSATEVRTSCPRPRTDTMGAEYRRQGQASRDRVSTHQLTEPLESEGNESYRHNLVCCLRPGWGDGRECTSCSEAEMRESLVQEAFATDELETCSVRLPHGQTLLEEMVMCGSQVAYARVSPDHGGASPKGDGAVTLCWLGMHTFWGGSLECQYRQRLLRRTSDDIRLGRARRGCISALAQSADRRCRCRSTATRLQLQLDAGAMA
jgi:hypothetical protein